MRRRELIALLGGAAAAWPLAARAQQREVMRRVGFLSGNASDDLQTQPSLQAFKQAFSELGWIEGRNVHIDIRFGAANVDRIDGFAKELVSLHPDVLVGSTTTVIAALANETKTIPIVFVVVSDPVGSGFVASLARPGGNITGFVNIEASMGGKWVEFLKEVSQGLTRAAFIFNPDTAPYYSYYLDPFENAARGLGVEAVAMPVRHVEELDALIGSLGERAGSGLALMPDAFTASRRVYEPIIEMAARYRIPAIYPYRYMAEVGGLLSYGTDNRDLYRRAPVYVDRILKGAKPAELPVQLPTKFEFVVNLKTARRLGIEVPLELRTFADDVIE